MKEVLKRTGFDFSERSIALKNVLWSRAVQHGVNGGTKVIINALNKINLVTATDEEIIRAIYAESGKIVDSAKGRIDESNYAKRSDGTYGYSEGIRNYYVKFAKENGIYGKSMGYFQSNSMEVQISVWKRLNIDEKNDAIKLIDAINVGILEIQPKESDIINHKSEKIDNKAGRTDSFVGDYNKIKPLGNIDKEHLNIDMKKDADGRHISYEYNDLVRLSYMLLSKGYISKETVNNAEDVKALQRTLYQIGLLGENNISGKFDHETDNAVKVLQKEMGLDGDGKFGEKTLEALGKIVFREYIDKESKTTREFSYINGVPHYRQGSEPVVDNNGKIVDYEASEWSSYKYSVKPLKLYNADKTKQTLAASACGPTSAAMAISKLTGKTVTPDITSIYAMLTGFRSLNAGTAGGFFKSIGEEYGLNVVETKSSKDVQEALRNGYPIVVNVKKGKFTSEGHFHVWADIREKDGDIEVRVLDPNRSAFCSDWHKLEDMLDVNYGHAVNFYIYKNKDE